MDFCTNNRTYGTPREFLYLFQQYNSIFNLHTCNLIKLRRRKSNDNKLRFSLVEERKTCAMH